MAFYLLHEVAYGGFGLGLTILGPESNIKRCVPGERVRRSIQRADLVNYIQTHYTAPRVVIAGAGSINHAHVS